MESVYYITFHIGKLIREHRDMKDNEKNVSINEIKSSLKAIEKTEQDTIKTLRMPIWLNIFISGSYGMGVFSWASTRHDNLWMLGVIISSVVFFFAVGIYMYSKRLVGIKPKVLPTHKSELKFGFTIAIFFGLVVVLSRELSIRELWWVAYLGGAIGSISLGYLLYFFPTGNYRAGKSNHV